MRKAGSGDAPWSTTGLRARLQSRERVVATFLLLPRVEVVELAGQAGFSAVIVDLEHGPITVGDVPKLAAAARAVGIHAIARVGDNDPVEIGQVLDAGVDGVMVPHVSSRADAERLVAAGRFPPHGERSINPYTRGNGFDLGGTQTVAGVDGRSALIAMLEGTDVLSNLEDICGTPGLDAVFIGPVDLAASLGLEGDAEHPKVVAAVEDALARAVTSGCTAGAYAPTARAGAAWVAAGASLVAVSADLAMILRAFRTTISTLEDSLASRLAPPQATGVA